MASSVPPLFPVELAGVVSRYRASERAKRARVSRGVPVGAACWNRVHWPAPHRSLREIKSLPPPRIPVQPLSSFFLAFLLFMPLLPPSLPPPVLLPFAAGSSESSFVSALSDAVFQTERTGNSSSSSFPTSLSRCYIWMGNVLIIRAIVVFCLRTKVGNGQACFEDRFQLMVVLLV